MAADMLELNAQQLHKLKKLFVRSPTKFARVSGELLNDFAFGVRNTSMETLREKLVIRNPRFMASRLQVDRARGRLPIQAQESTVGSVGKKRFTGWREQQTGEKSTRERVATLIARKGSRKRQIAPSARLKPSLELKRFTDYPGASPNMRSTRMLQALDRARWKKPFYLTKKRGIQPGVWVFKGRKLRPLQLFKRGKKLKRNPWLTDARDRYFQREDIGRLWARKIERIFRR